LETLHAAGPSLGEPSRIFGDCWSTSSDTGMG
jgi:hypothetical protein